MHRSRIPEIPFRLVKRPCTREYTRAYIHTYIHMYVCMYGTWVAYICEESRSCMYNWMAANMFRARAYFSWVCLCIIRSRVRQFIPASLSPRVPFFLFFFFQRAASGTHRVQRKTHSCCAIPWWWWWVLGRRGPETRSKRRICVATGAPFLLYSL